MNQSGIRTNHRSKGARSSKSKVATSSKANRNSRHDQNGEVLISAVVSPYLLTHLHHVLQRAEYGAAKEGRKIKAANFAQLRKVLCMDARSMKDASALGLIDGEVDCVHESNFGSKVA
tara:strand:+ start:808 stop:1161 length:354 start_codon:yes stop_codon:yes gene_type:complete